jgi:hypothetical protein
MLFNWWKKKDRAPSEEWPQFTDNLTDPLMSPSLPKARRRSHQDDKKVRARTNEEIVAAARLVY